MPCSCSAPTKTAEFVVNVEGLVVDLLSVMLSNEQQYFSSFILSLELHYQFAFCDIIEINAILMTSCHIHFVKKVQVKRVFERLYSPIEILIIKA